jgi:hypothetical protein
MFENRPSVTKGIGQELSEIAAATGIELSLKRLPATLMTARQIGQRGDEMHSVALDLRVDVRSPESMKVAAAELRELADIIEAAARKR